MPLTRFYSVAQKHAYGQTDRKFRFIIFGSTVHSLTQIIKCWEKLKFPLFIIIQVTFSDVLGGLLRGLTTLTNAVSGQSQNCSGNLEISPGIGTLGNFSGKHAIIPGHCRKKSGHPVMYPQNSGGWSKSPGRLKLRPSIDQTAFVRVVTPHGLFQGISYSVLTTDSLDCPVQSNVNWNWFNK